MNIKVITEYLSFMEKTFKEINKNIEKIDFKTFQEINRRQLLLFFNSLDINDFFDISFNSEFIGRIFSLLIESYVTYFGTKYIDFSKIHEDEDFFNFQRSLTFLMKNYQNIVSIQLRDEKFQIDDVLETLLTEEMEIGENDLYFEPLPTQQKFVTGIEQYENIFLLIDTTIYDMFSTFNSFTEIKRDFQYDYKITSDILDYQITNSGFIIEMQDNTQKNDKLNKSLLKNKTKGDVKNVFTT